MQERLRRNHVPCSKHMGMCKQIVALECTTSLRLVILIFSSSPGKWIIRLPQICREGENEPAKPVAKELPPWAVKDLGKAARVEDAYMYRVWTLLTY
jgi:hypothetical protein